MKHLHLLRGALCSPIPTFIMRFFHFWLLLLSCLLQALAGLPPCQPQRFLKRSNLVHYLLLLDRLLHCYSRVIELAPPRRPSVMIITPADFCGISSTATIVNRGHVGRFLFAFLRPTRFNVTGKRRARFFASASSRHVFRHQLRQSGC